jgi:hypothetical protein
MNEQKKQQDQSGKMTCKYQIDEVWYSVLTKCNLGVKKIYMTDENGIEWYRYPVPPISYVIERYVIVGRSWSVFEGDCKYGYPYVEYEMMNQETNEYVNFLEEEFDGTTHRKFFRSLKEAEHYVKEKTNEYRN